MAKKAYGRTGTDAVPCYKTHKVIPVEGGGKLIGGRCGNPTVNDADAYISFDSLTHPVFPESFPWNQGGDSFLFPIPNGSVPSDVDEFHSMVEWTCQQLTQGKTIHCGCIGGHGRTGVFIAAVVATLESDFGFEPQGLTYSDAGDGFVYPDITKWVRENYCERAVETQVQVDWLLEHYSVTAEVPYYKIKALRAKATPVSDVRVH